MRFVSSILGQLLEAVDRRQVQAIVDRHDGDAYDKSFKSWDHLVALIYAQLGGVDSLRGLENCWNANAQHHYHLDCGPLSRSTLSDANKRRRPVIFAEIFGLLTAQLDRQTRSEGRQMLRLIDSTPIPLGKLSDWARWNGRIRGLKMHLAYDPHADCPRLLDVTDATVNDAKIGRTILLEEGATYVFDKGYCHYGWWNAIHQTKACFVTRPKSRMALKVLKHRALQQQQGEGFFILEDCEVQLASKGDSKLDMPLRRIKIMRENNQVFFAITNNMHQSPVAIGTLYKLRWQIELLFRWLKQHLRIRKFLGNNDNAIRLQLLAAMIAYVLLRIAANANRIKIDILRFAELVNLFILQRRPIAAIHRPPIKNLSTTKLRHNPDQIAFAFG